MKREEMGLPETGRFRVTGTRWSSQAGRSQDPLPARAGGTALCAARNPRCQERGKAG